MKRVLAVLVCLSAISWCTSGSSAQSSSAQKPGVGRVRTYYIAADDVTWDYAPGDKDGITGEPVNATGFFKGTNPDAFRSQSARSI